MMNRRTLIRSLLAGWIAVATLASSFASPVERKTIVSGPKGGELDRYLQRCELFGFSGSVLVARGKEVLLRKGYGEARPGEEVPNTPETLYDIASASKQFTATAILKLEAERKLSTNDSIAMHLADVPGQHHEVTIQHLLNHTSGFSRFGRGGGGTDRDKAVASYLAAPRHRAAGAKHEYYNGGYALLAAIVERVSGVPYDTYVSEELFGPAGMQHSFLMDTAEEDDPLLARSHDGGKLTTDYLRHWSYKGMGGVITSVSDLHLWIRALHSGKILPEKSLKKLFTPALDNYACGWYVLPRPRNAKVVSHGGTAPGFQSYIRHFVEEDVLVLVMSNREGMHWQVTWALSAMMVKEEAKSPPPPETVEWPAEKLDALTGVFSSKKNGRLVVRRAGGALRLGAEGPGAIAILTGTKPTKDDDYEWERTRAAEIIAELLAGSSELLGKDLMPHIPSSWPRTILTRTWPEHVKQHGDISSFEEIGARYDPRTKRVSAWVRLHHPEKTTTVEIAFVDQKLNIFDLKASNYPIERAYAPIDKKKRFATFDFSTDKLPTMEIEAKRGGGAALKIKVGSKTYEFVRAGD